MRMPHFVAAFAAPVIMMAVSSAAHAQALLLDDFTSTRPTNPDSKKWTVRTGSNGAFFGCEFATSEVWVDKGVLNLNVNPNTKKCGEIKSIQKFKYGKYLIRMTPSTFAGGNSSFFLYTGSTGGANDHFEIDIELIKGGTTLHTNYFINGSDNAGKNVKQFAAGKGPFQVGFEWRADSIRWFYVDGRGKEVDYRRVFVKIPNEMNLFMNHWYSNNNNRDSVNFLGRHLGGGGVATYDKVEVYP
jgi:endo-1,3-1,4-beta-glycanase ExoK